MKIAFLSNLGYYSAMSEFVNIRRYGCEDEESPDVVLLVTRGSDASGLFDRFPGLMDAMGSPEELNDYLRLEEESGAAALADRIPLVMKSTSKGAGCRVHVVEAKLPPGIVDIDRHSPLRHVLPWNPVPALRGKLIDIYKEVRFVIDEELAALQQRDGVFVDIHTVLPFPPACMPIEAPVQERPFHLGDYVSLHQAAVDFARIGRIKTINRTRKKINVQTRDERCDLADVRLRHTLLHALEDLGQEAFTENAPCVSQDSQAALRLNAFSGIRIEVPRDLLADISPADSPFNIHYPRISEKKVSSMAAPIAQALAARIRP